MPDSTTPSAPAAPKPRLLDQVRSAIRFRHYSRETEKSYVYWVRYFILFHAKRHPAQMGAAEVTAFLSWLASERKVAASTQNQALAALLFLYRQVLDVDLPWLDGVVRAKRPVRLPTVLSEAQVRRLLSQLEGTGWLMASLLYGAGLRQGECLGLRVKDVDFAYRQVLVRSGKGGKDRVTMLPEGVVQPLQAHLGRVHALHRKDLAEGYGEVSLPHALARKYPRAGREWGWQFVFPSGKRSVDPEDGVIRRHHIYPDTLGRMIGRAARAAGIAKPVSCHTLRLVCDAPAADGVGHPYGAGASRPLGCIDHNDLYTRDEQRGTGCKEPARPAGAAARGLCGFPPPAPSCCVIAQQVCHASRSGSRVLPTKVKLSGRRQVRRRGDLYLLRTNRT